MSRGVLVGVRDYVWTEESLFVKALKWDLFIEFVEKRGFCSILKNFEKKERIHATKSGSSFILAPVGEVEELFGLRWPGDIVA